MISCVKLVFARTPFHIWPAWNLPYWFHNRSRPWTGQIMKSCNDRRALPRGLLGFCPLNSLFFLGSGSTRPQALGFDRAAN